MERHSSVASVATSTNHPIAKLQGTHEDTHMEPRMRVWDVARVRGVARARTSAYEQYIREQHIDIERTYLRQCIHKHHLDVYVTFDLHRCVF